MAQQYPAITDKHREFITAQHMFFVATAAPDGRVNVSPKGLDALRVLSPNRVAWLSVTGSGNETAAHLLESKRMTLLFCAFTGQPMILRLYGEATAVYPRDPAWDALFAHFRPIPGTRQIFDVHVDMVQTSCGFAVPLYDYVGQRDLLVQWAENRGEEEVEAYRRENNQVSLDNRPTGLYE